MPCGCSASNQVRLEKPISSVVTVMAGRALSHRLNLEMWCCLPSLFLSLIAVSFIWCHPIQVSMTKDNEGEADVPPVDGTPDTTAAEDYQTSLA